PRLEVVFAIRRAPQVAGAGVDDVVRQAEALEDGLLDLQELQVDRLALLRQTEREHLDLGELMHAIEAPGVPAWGAGLGAEAVGQPDVALWQLACVEDTITMHTAEGDLGGGDQAKVAVGDAVDLSLGRVGIARDEADALEHLDARQVRGDDRR